MTGDMLLSILLSASCQIPCEILIYRGRILHIQIPFLNETIYGKHDQRLIIEEGGANRGVTVHYSNSLFQVCPCDTIRMCSLTQYDTYDGYFLMQVYKKSQIFFFQLLVRL